MTRHFLINQVLLLCLVSSCVSPQGHKQFNRSKLIDSYETFFNALPRKKDAIDLTQLKPLPGGGTHRIYLWERNPEYLIKVMVSVGDRSFDELDAIKKELAEKYDKLYAIFGDVNCIVEQRFIAKLSEQSVYPDKLAIISIAKYEPAFHGIEKFGFNAEAIEPDRYVIDASINKYHNMNAYLIGDNSFTSSGFVFDDFFIFNSGFKNIFSKLDESRFLQTSMRDFLQKFRRYFVETGEFMDFKGHDNVIFFKEGDHWDYRIGSVIKNVTRENFIKALALFNDDPQFINESFENRVLITYVPSWIRSLNAVGIKLGIGRIIDNISISKRDSTNLGKTFDALPFTSKMRIAMEHEDYESAVKYFKNFERSEELHNSVVRKERTIQYWQNIQKNTPVRFGKEILVFLKMISDPKNDFTSLSTSQKKELASIILKMRDLALTKYTLEKELKESISVAVQALNE